MPIGLAGVRKAIFTAYVLGGKARHCPGLIPLHTLIKMGCVIICGYFGNQDGLMGIRMPNGKYVTQVLKHIDSGHYMLPTDQFGQASNRNLDRAVRLKASNVGASTSPKRQMYPTFIAFIDNSEQSCYPDFQ